MQLTLHGNHRFPPRIHYNGNKTGSSWLSRAVRRTREELVFYMCWINMASQHNYKMYLKQLQVHKETLSKVSLEDLYERYKIGKKK